MRLLLFLLPAFQAIAALVPSADGAMTYDSAVQFIARMNSSAYLGQRNWQMPAIDPTCPGYHCDGNQNPLGNLFYAQLGFTPGMPAIPLLTGATGPFHNMQPYLYWTCGAATIQDPCSNNVPAPNFEWSCSFGSGFQGTDLMANDLYVTAYFVGSRPSISGPEITQVANAEGESAMIAPKTWVEIKGSNLAPAGHTRIWQGADFANGNMPIQLDGVSVTVNGKSAYVYYISPTQINILTPPDAMRDAVQVVVSNNGTASIPFVAQGQPLSPSFFVFNGGPYVAAVHVNGTLIGPASLYPGSTTPANPGETILLFANGFGPTTIPVVSGSATQGGTLTPLPVLKIGGITATVQFAGLVAPGEFQFNVVVPPGIGGGDQPVTATFNGVTTQAGTLIAIAGASQPTSVTYYVSPTGNDSWSGTLPAPNAANSDGPLATFDRARAAVQALNKAGLTHVTVQFRAEFTICAPRSNSPLSTPGRRTWQSTIGTIPVRRRSSAGELGW